jgi:hypothetical protein
MSCGDSKPLGDGYYFINYSSKQNDITYCFRGKKCYQSGYLVIPSNITNYNYNHNWIVAETVDRNKSKKYWVVKKISINISERRANISRVEGNVYGPYTKARFNTVIDSLGVDIYVE